MPQRKAKIKYRSYDPTLYPGAIEVLEDVDEYYQDLVHTLEGINEPKIFITSWLLHSWVYLKRNFDLEDLLIRELKKENSAVYILWNTNYNGLPYEDLASKSLELYRRIRKRISISEDNLKIILSTNLRFTPPDLPWQTDLAFSGAQALQFLGIPIPPPPSIADWMQELWIKKFPKNSEDYGNLAVFTFGSHHQKTFTIVGKQQSSNNASTLIAYAGGIDFSSGPSGHKSGVFYGGKWWYDIMMRVRGEHAFKTLENFAERWNEDLELVKVNQTISYGVSDNDQLNADQIAAEWKDTPSNAVETARTMPLGGVDWPLGRSRVTDSLEAYQEWIPEATEHIILINQYFRHEAISELLVDRLNDVPGLRISIIMPSYTEEIGKRKDLVKVRNQYAKAIAGSQARQRLLAKAQQYALTIDPLNKLTLFMRSRELAKFSSSPRVRIWIPNPLGKRPGTPYVHGKIMIVDNKAMMVGSANLNGRSLDGLADSELNLLLTESTEIQRIKNIHRWHIEPESETAANYAGSWYEKHRMLRYSEDHRSIDEVFGQFPSGKNNILDYFDKFVTSGRVEKMMGKRFNRTEVEDHLDNVPAGIDIDGDLGQQLAEITGHLV